MFCPRKGARIEEGLDCGGFRIDAGQVRALVQVAVVARERRIRFDRRSPVLPRQDVFDMKAEERVVVLVNVAVFTTPAGEFQYELSPSGVHPGCGLMQQAARRR